jgi:hypothetical protein
MLFKLVWRPKSIAGLGQANRVLCVVSGVV